MVAAGKGIVIFHKEPKNQQAAMQQCGKNNARSTILLPGDSSTIFWYADLSFSLLSL